MQGMGKTLFNGLIYPSEWLFDSLEENTGLLKAGSDLQVQVQICTFESAHALIQPSTKISVSNNNFGV